MATDAAWIERVREMGYTMIAGGTDTGLLQDAYARLVGQITERTALSDPAPAQRTLHSTMTRLRPRRHRCSIWPGRLR